MIYIMDASAMLAFLRDEAGADVIETYLLEPGSHSLAHSINLCEVFYDFVRAESEAQAQQAIADLLDIGVSERSDLDAAFWQEAGKLKAVHRRVSLANCLAYDLITISQHVIQRGNNRLFPRFLPRRIITAIACARRRSGTTASYMPIC
jgi:PIN domain nuclease of toxin-antitoxin system